MAVRVERLGWRDVDLGEVKLPRETVKLTLGLGSGMSVRDGRIFAVTDRGPNLFVTDAVSRFGLTGFEGVEVRADAKILPLPELCPEIVELSVKNGQVVLGARIPLRTALRELSGLAPAGAGMERVFDVSGKVLPPDPLGVDIEAIAAMPDGGFFLAEEYGPSILKVDRDGIVRERWVPEGSEDQFDHADINVRGVLPQTSRLRRPNRGFEALCASPDGAWLYVGFQSARVAENQRLAPILKLEAASGTLAAEFLYRFDEPDSFGRDARRRKLGEGDLKICEFAWLGEDRLLVLERIAHSTKIYAISLGDVSEKQLVISSDDYPEIGPDIEGMALLSPREILLVSDNDFGVEGAETGFWRVSLDDDLTRS